MAEQIGDSENYPHVYAWHNIDNIKYCYEGILGSNLVYNLFMGHKSGAIHRTLFALNYTSQGEIFIF
jgi:hypothetical protein